MLLSLPELLLYAGFLYVAIASMTMLMDKSRYALLVEGVKASLGLGMLFLSGDWFQLSAAVPFGYYLVGAYLVVSLMAVGYFHLSEVRSQEESLQAA